MEITRKCHAKTRKQWRAWLEKHHSTKKEIWLVYYKKHAGKPSVPYNDAVEEALCFGWIDSTVKTIDKDSYAQRFTPRNAKSVWSEPNKERVRLLIAKGLMTPAGLAKCTYHHAPHEEPEKITVKKDVLAKLKADAETWKHFQSFDQRYKRIRIGWIEAVREKPDIFRQRLDYFLKMTKKGKKYGMLER